MNDVSVEGDTYLEIYRLPGHVIFLHPVYLVSFFPDYKYQRKELTVMYVPNVVVKLANSDTHKHPVSARAVNFD